MARGTITPYVVDRTDGLDLSTVVATVGVPADGHKIPNRGRMFFDVENTNVGVTARSVTIHLLGGSDGQGIEPKITPIAAGKTIRFGPYPANLYGGYLLVDVAHAELEITAYELQG
jgi:hypothetical protein